MTLGTATLETLTSKQAEAERTRLLQELGLDMAALEERAADGLLDAEEFRVWRRVRTLNWLLDENA